MGLLRRIEGGTPQKQTTIEVAGAPQPPHASHAGVITPPRTPPGPARPGQAQVVRDLRKRVKSKLIAELDPNMDLSKTTEVRQRIKSLFDQIVESESIVLTRVERDKLFEEVAADIIGFGPIEPLLQDASISEVMVNGPEQIYIEQKGKVNVAIPPVSLIGPCVTIRKFSKTPLTIDDLIRFDSITPEIAEFLRACVVSRLNLVVSGGTGSGKTTLLNVLSGFIPDDERIVTVEDAAELQLRQDHVVRMEARPANIEGKGAISIRDLVINCLRMRPDRIVVGECRGQEALDMLQAMNTGHDGSLTTGHANSPRDMLARLETMVLMAGMDLPVTAIRQQVSSAVDLIVQQSRMRDGSRKVTNITEVQGMEGDVIVLQDIFTFQQDSYENGKVIGRIVPTGVRPRFMPKIEDAGIHMGPQVFGIGGDRFF